MSKGKFEAARGSKPTAGARTGGARPSSVSSGRPAPRTNAARPAGTQNSGASRAPRKPAKRRAGSFWPILAAVAGVAVVILVALLALKLRKDRQARRNAAAGTGSEVLMSENPASAGTAEYRPHGLPRAELEENARLAAEALQNNDMVLTLEPMQRDSGDKAGGEQPIVLTLSPAESGADLDLNRLRADLNAGRGKAGEDDYVVDLGDYLSLNEDAIRALAENTVETRARPYSDATAEVVTKKDGSKVLVLKKGVTGRSFTAEHIASVLKDAYLSAARSTSSENPTGTTLFRAKLSYFYDAPKDLDLSEVYDRLSIAPQDAKYDPEKDEIINDVPGFGFDLDKAREKYEAAAEGEEVRLAMTERKAKLTAKKLKKVLFRDTIASFDTVHSWNMPRTNNLILACKALDGTVIQPGEIFSFNKTVGERTEEKGYQAAEAYVSGGVSKPELGGGVCQVASTIYCAVLYADLETVERYNHMYAVPYTPDGMDAAIYWGMQDYKFRNTSGYPIKMQASVSGGKVHIKLIGTEWKDYTIQMSCKTWSSTEYETVVKDYPRDSGYKEGQVVQTPYTGYEMTTYRTVIKADGTEGETTKVADSHYSKRNEIIAHLVDDPEESSETPPPPPPPTTTAPPPPPPTTTAPPPPPPTTTEPPTEPPTTTVPPTAPPTEPETEPATELITEPVTEPDTQPVETPAPETTAESTTAE